MSATEVSLFADYFASLLADAIDPTTDIADTTTDITDTTTDINTINSMTHTTNTMGHITDSTGIHTQDRNSEDYTYFASFDIANKFLMNAIYRYLGKGQNTGKQIENFRAIVIRDGLDTKIIPVKKFFRKLL